MFRRQGARRLSLGFWRRTALAASFPVSGLPSHRAASQIVPPGCSHVGLRYVGTRLLRVAPSWGLRACGGTSRVWGKVRPAHGRTRDLGLDEVLSQCIAYAETSLQPSQPGAMHHVGGRCQEPRIQGTFLAHSRAGVQDGIPEPKGGDPRSRILERGRRHSILTPEVWRPEPGNTLPPLRLDAASRLSAVRQDLTCVEDPSGAGTDTFPLSRSNL